MNVRTHSPSRNRMPEQGGTGIARMPEQGGTGIRAACLALAMSLALPFAAAQANESVWIMSGELQGPAQVSIDDNQRMQLSFMLADKKQGTLVYAATGTVKDDFARLALFRVDMDGKKGELVASGSIDLFLGHCGADGELRLKSESEGSGGKDFVNHVFSLTQPLARCLLKSESEGSGSP
jgi:hypothetical protein